MSGVRGFEKAWRRVGRVARRLVAIVRVASTGFCYAGAGVGQENLLATDDRMAAMEAAWKAFHLKAKAALW